MMATAKTIQVDVLGMPAAKRLAADLALALRLLDAHTWPPEQVPCRFDHHGGCQEHGFLSLEPGEKCPNQEAHELLVRHGIRQAEGESTAYPDSSLLAWGLHEVDPDGRWGA